MVYISKLKEIQKLYKGRLNDLGYEIDEVNKKRFDQSLINHFEQFGAEKWSDVKQKLLISPQES